MNVIEYLNRVSREHNEPLMEMKDGGLSLEEIERVESELGVTLPTEYKEYLRKYDVSKLSIRNTDFYPTGFIKYGMVDKIIKANLEEVNPFYERYKELGLVEIGAYDAHPISINEQGQLFVLEMHTTDFPISFIASSFTEFLTLSTIMYKVHKENPDLEEDTLVEKTLSEMAKVQESVREITFWEDVIRGI